MNDGGYAREAMNEAKNCKPEDKGGKPRPKVGAVAVAPDGSILARAYRGELVDGADQTEPCGDHAEYVLLELKLKGVDLRGVTVYTTLEPCVKRGWTKDKKKKEPCAERLIERGVSRVVIGMLDPNPDVIGKGYGLLRQDGVEVGLFPGGWQGFVEQQNEEFSAPYERFRNVLASELIKNGAASSLAAAAAISTSLQLKDAQGLMLWGMLRDSDGPGAFAFLLRTAGEGIEHLEAISACPPEEILRMRGALNSAREGYEGATAELRRMDEELEEADKKEFDQG